MAYVNPYNKRFLIGDWVDVSGTKYQIMDFKLSGMILVRTLGKQDEWVYRVLSPDTLNLRWVD